MMSQLISLQGSKPNLKKNFKGKSVKLMGQKMKVSPELKDIINMDEATKAMCSRAIFAYIKTNELSDPADDNYFTPDTKMSKIFGKDRMKASKFTFMKVSSKYLIKLEKA